MPIPHTINLTGNIYIKYIDDIKMPIKGDLILLLNDDAISLKFKNYYEPGLNGYIKAQIYDGKIWQYVNITEFCADRENKLTKSQRPIDSFSLCKEKLSQFQGTLMHKTYRGHFTKELYEPTPFLRKAKYAKTKNNK